LRASDCASSSRRFSSASATSAAATRRVAAGDQLFLEHTPFADRFAFGERAAPVPQPVETGVAPLDAKQSLEVGTGHGPPGFLVVGGLLTVVGVVLPPLLVVVVVLGFLGLIVVVVGGAVVVVVGAKPVPRPVIAMYAEKGQNDGSGGVKFKQRIRREGLLHERAPDAGRDRAAVHGAER